MNRIPNLEAQRGAKLKELDALRNGAESRAFNKEEAVKFDTIEADVRALNEDIEREKRAHGLAVVESEKAKQVNSALGLTDKEVRKYSLLRAINCLAEGRQVDGFEGEVSDSEAKRIGRSAQGFFVPAELFSAEKRTNQVQVGSDGGLTVGQDIDFSNTVALLRNQSQVMGLGARVITGLVNDVAIPRVLTGAVAYWVSETGSIAQSSGTFGQIQMKPRRLGASVPYTKQFLNQSGLSVESFIRDDIMAAFGIELDRVAINGAGATEPLGILNLASADRATGVTFGAAATWAKVVSFETNVGTANAINLPGSKYAYLSTPATKGAWKTTSKVANQAIFLWEAGDMVNGYDARATNQVPSDKVIYGQFGQVIYGEWAGIDVTVDPFTLARTGQVQITIQKFVDMIIRQPKAFSVSSDSGAQ